MYELIQYIGKLYAVIMATGVATLAVFYLMQWLAQPDQQPSEQPPVAVPDLRPLHGRRRLEPADPLPPVSRVRPRAPAPRGTGPLQLALGMELPPVAVSSWPLATPGPAALDPLALVKTAPHYPPRARFHGIEGHVLVEFDVNSQGFVVNPRVVRSQPVGEFDTAVLEAVEKWRYRPRRVNGRPAKVFGVRQRLDFMLDEEDVPA